MNQPISLFSIFSTILQFFLVLNFYGGWIANGDLIDNLCKSISSHDPHMHYEFCVSSLEANPLSKSSDIFGLAVISMELCKNNATYIPTYIDSILKDGKVEPEARVCLGNCIEFYSMALDDVEEGMKSFKDKDYESALRQVGYADIDRDTCKDGFIEAGIDFNPLKKQDNDFTNLISISLGIIARIQGKVILR
ncbi:hypothetical protein MKW94_006627 [Papaver nudicaule]|uniref:Pectinesterase inhibitor domain-containing protein n=1 Tax=Papaver nudicaule TaxID=74823 RepID=A0AA41VZD3_PAPNU|nr:hypothetical protein [Papaver nudicaule]